MYYKYAVIDRDSVHLYKTKPSVRPMSEDLYELNHIDLRKQFFVGGKVILRFGSMLSKEEIIDTVVDKDIKWEREYWLFGKLVPTVGHKWVELKQRYREKVHLNNYKVIEHLDDVQN